MTLFQKGTGTSKRTTALLTAPTNEKRKKPWITKYIFTYPLFRTKVSHQIVLHKWKKV